MYVCMYVHFPSSSGEAAPVLERSIERAKLSYSRLVIALRFVTRPCCKASQLYGELHKSSSC